MVLKEVAVISSPLFGSSGDLTPGSSAFIMFFDLINGCCGHEDTVKQ